MTSKSTIGRSFYWLFLMFLDRYSLFMVISDWYFFIGTNKVKTDKSIKKIIEGKTVDEEKLSVTI